MLKAVFPFEGTRAKCAVCKTVVDGTYKRGGLYYCADDYEQTSVQEKLQTSKTKKEEKEIKRFLKNA